MKKNLIIIDDTVEIPEYDPNFKPINHIRFEPGLFYHLDFLELNGEEEKSLIKIWRNNFILPNYLFFMSIREEVNALCFAYLKGGSAKDKAEADLVFLHNIRTKIRNRCKILQNIREEKAKKCYKMLIPQWYMFTYR